MTNKEHAKLIIDAGEITDLALGIMDVWPYESEQHRLAEQIWDLASKLESLIEDQPK